MQTGAVLARQTVIDTAHCVPAGARVSVIPQREAAQAGSEDEAEWTESGLYCAIGIWAGWWAFSCTTAQAPFI